MSFIELKVFHKNNRRVTAGRTATEVNAIEKTAAKKSIAGKAGMGLLLCALSLFLLSACSSMGPYAESCSEEEVASQMRYIHWDQIYSPGEGYHFPGFSWGGSFSEFQEQCYYPVTDFVSYLSDGGRVYSAGNLHVDLLGRVNDDAEVHTDDQDKVVSVSIAYRKGKTEGLTEAELFDQYYLEIRRGLGEESRKEETVLTIGSAHYNVETYYWESTVNYRQTRLQWSKATIAGQTAPEYVALGFSVQFLNNAENETK